MLNHFCTSNVCCPYWYIVFKENTRIKRNKPQTKMHFVFNELPVYWFIIPGKIVFMNVVYKIVKLLKQIVAFNFDIIVYLYLVYYYRSIVFRIPFINTSLH